jgi:hypothetical protein
VSVEHLSPDQFNGFISHDYGTPIGETNIIATMGDEYRVKEIMRTARKHGFAKPVRVDYREDPPVLRDGHHRLEAARRLGIPVPTADYWNSEEQDKPRVLP